MRHAEDFLSSLDFAGHLGKDAGVSLVSGVLAQPSK